MRWLDPLLDPHELEVGAQRGSDDPRGGLALLLDAQLFVYERLAARYTWPRLGDRPRKSWSREHRLLAAVGLQLTGGRGTSAAYESLLNLQPSAGETSFATAVAVLWALHLGDLGHDDEAVEILERAATRRHAEALDRMLVLLHLGVREAERDGIEAAIDATERARAVRPERRAQQHHRALQRVAEHNLAAYRQQLGERIDLFQLPLRATELPLVRGTINISAGLEKYLDDQFAQATRDPWGRSIIWRPEDPVEMPLRGAVTRAECLADWSEQRHARSLLGRYHVVSKLGTREGVAPEAFALLRRAGDREGLTAAARSVAAIGPLGALRSETLRALRSPWPRVQVPATLALISGGADLLRQKEADQAVKRLVASPELVVRYAPLALRAIARLATAASDKTQTPVSRFAREMARQSADALVLQELRRVVASVRWPTVSTAERRRWLDYIREHQITGGDSRLLAEQAAAALARSEPEAVAQIVVDSFEASLDLGRLALVVDVNIPLSRELRRRALDVASVALDEIRRQAASGTYGLGGIDVGLLTLKLLRIETRDPRWDELGAFLIDSRVGVDAKVRTIEALADQRGVIPGRIQELLRKNVATITGFIDGLGASEPVLRGATLRLWLRLGGLRRGELLSRLLELAGNLDREARLQAALTLPASQRRLGDDSTFTLGLTLTRDADVTVRAIAGESLARLRRERAGELNAEVTERLVALLEEPGTDVPYRTIAGLVETARNGQPVEKATLDAVARLRLSHPSQRVEQAATVLLNEVAPGR